MHSHSCLPSALAASLLLLTGCVGDYGASKTTIARYDFDATAPGALPEGLVVGGSAYGGAPRWQVVEDATAPTGDRVLEQSDPNGEDPRYCVLLSQTPVARDVRVSVSCQPIDGRLDRSAGVVFRAVDDRNYYVVRANLLEKDIQLYRCVDGVRVPLEYWKQRLPRGRWHTLEAEMRGDAITVRWNGEMVIETTDATFTEAGRAGIWTKADAVTRFDRLVIELLD